MPKNTFIKLESETVSIDSLPQNVVFQKKPIGRLAVLWAKLQSLEPGKAEKVISRDRAHSTQTICHMRKRCTELGRVLNERRDPDSTIVYLWLEPK